MQSEMSISLRTQKMLWGRSANRCAFTECRKELVEVSEGKGTSIGEVCHIIAERSRGPRGDSRFPKEQLNEYDNLILLCAAHHKVVDDQVASYEPNKLREIKRAHEDWVSKSLSADAALQNDEELFASYLDEWSVRANLPCWRIWTARLLEPQPRLSKAMADVIECLRDWLFNRIWPPICPQLQESLLNFRLVATDLLLTFHEHSQERREELVTERFYRIDSWDPQLYSELICRFDAHVDLIYDLTLELTRAANYVCDKVRGELLKSYRLQEGLLIVERGPLAVGRNFQRLIIKTEYRKEERASVPYPGLEKFREIRFERDVCFSRR